MDNTDNKPVSKQTLYQIASRHSRAAIERLVELMNSTNENVALGAAKVLLQKTIPDLKHEENVVEFNQTAVLTDSQIDQRIRELTKQLASG
jgi:hypothetical protein